jgi:hypothetical protein
MIEAFFQPAVLIPMLTSLGVSVLGFATLWVKQHYASADLRAQLECQVEQAKAVHEVHAAEVHEQVVKLQNVGQQLVEAQAAITKQQDRN